MKVFLLLAAINGFLAVALGAFGAHGLENRLSEKMLNTWEKAVTYQMFHVGALLATSLAMMKITATSLSVAGWFFLAGIIIFSGSLYLYSTTNVKTFAMITPIGGFCFLIGWVLFGYAIVKFL
ncbi:uncharacterized membrane protein YgdD (TMEM256/DUF423 family) [Gracilibacillus halotolerans]|uniref:Uncharacterized membrane protein YgdD (TMEM256/DUF423 family) n=1 Tax=Gracilibacillus halotolerans TaxID=74386 RepID=A0A841RK30_9BACI|nr:DUF423 domain-containing protein [Gracilibacillus halotolerans]MBB6513061.1 uncharacterized membrane protein YgdD (TMEM256/DUF423 family) [Gracilibacillus halotolerans]